MNDRLFKPAVETLANQLPDIGDTTAAKLVELSRDPSPERCELVQHHLRGLQQYIAQLREASRQQATTA